MVHSGYISNKSRVVLNHTANDTYVFVIVENIESQSSTNKNTSSVESILRALQRQEGHCRAGTDVLRLVGWLQHLTHITNHAVIN